MALQIQNYRALIGSGSLKGFYDDIVYWEIIKNRNRFFVTFMDGKYGFPNNKMESIGTSEIGAPLTPRQTSSQALNAINSGINRVTAPAPIFLQDDEFYNVSNNSSYPTQSHKYNGFVPVTELRGTRFFKTTITSSEFVNRTYTYHQHDADAGSVDVFRTVSASYFYPFSDHQLSVLREEPTVIINLSKKTELYNGIGEKGFVLVPEETHQVVRDNLEYYLEKAGLIEKTTTTKAPLKGK